MKRQKTVISIIIVSFAMLMLILDSKTALSGAYEGLELCLRVIIPSLFPFFVVSMLLTSLLSGKAVVFLRPLGKLLRLPHNGENILLIGLLGGYPVGAQCITQAYKAGSLSRNDAERMLAFCNNAGPAFIFGVGAGILPEAWMCWALWLIHILSALITGLLTPANTTDSCVQFTARPISVSEAVNRSIRTLASVCGWIIIFRIILAFLERWFLWLLPESLSILFCGILELANGCCELTSLTSLDARFCLFAVMLGFGGFCVALQTYSVLAGSGLSSKNYLPGKIAQAAISYLLSLLFVLAFQQNTVSLPYAIPMMLSCIVCFSYIAAHKNKKFNIAFH